MTYAVIKGTEVLCLANLSLSVDFFDTKIIQQLTSVLGLHVPLADNRPPLSCNLEY